MDLGLLSSYKVLDWLERSPFSVGNRMETIKLVLFPRVVFRKGGEGPRGLGLLRDDPTPHSLLPPNLTSVTPLSSTLLVSFPRHVSSQVSGDGTRLRVDVVCTTRWGKG